MISAGGIPYGGLSRSEQRPHGLQRRPIRVAGDPYVQSGKVTLNFEPAMMVDILRNAVLPAARRAFGPRFSSYVDAIAFLKQCGYSSLKSLPNTFQKSYKSRMFRILKLRYPAFKRNLDRYFGRFSGKGAKAVRDSASAKLVYRTIYNQTQVSGATGYKCSAGTSAPATPARPTPLLVPATPVRPRPVVNQIKLRRALLAAVRRVRRFRSYSDKRAKGVLKYSWSMLKIMQVAPHILRVFRKFRKPTHPEAAEAELKEILRNWRTSSGSVQPSRTPARPAPVRVRPRARPVAPVHPRPRPVDNQLKIQSALIKAVKKVRTFKKYSDKRAKGVLRYSWGMLTAMKVAPHILRVFRKFGKPTLPKAAEAELKVILSKWK